MKSKNEDDGDGDGDSEWTIEANVNLGKLILEVTMCNLTFS